MVNRHRFFGMEIREPSETEAKRAALFFGLAQMLMRTLQGSQSEPGGSDRFRLAQRVPLARAITVQCDQQRRGPLIANDHVITQINLRGHKSLDRLALI